ncbi:MAG TPA: dihydrofolate reductase family protein [Gammaproteobacteria bacterium]|nr:dihydrofolate reductase family protein [Gammaproteobacteria bacterium]
MPPTASSLDRPLEKLFPPPAETRALRGLYLEERDFAPEPRPADVQRPFVYASFVASLDGRIALPDPKTQTHVVPKATANPRDWRLFQELAARADVLVTTGRYIRDLAQGVAQDDLPVSAQPPFADLLEWRRARGLPPQPAVAIVSASLNLPIPRGVLESGRAIYLATGSAAGDKQVAAVEAQGLRVLRAGEGMRVQGRRLVEALHAEGYGRIDMIAGAELLNTLIADGVLDRLYLTQVSRLLGGLSFDTLIKGQRLDPPAGLALRALHFDAGAGDGPEQLFGVYDVDRGRHAPS